jgi:hypothetical protein
MKEPTPFTPVLKKKKKKTIDSCRAHRKLKSLNNLGRVFRVDCQSILGGKKRTRDGLFIPMYSISVKLPGFRPKFGHEPSSSS